MEVVSYLHQIHCKFNIWQNVKFFIDIGEVVQVCDNKDKCDLTESDFSFASIFLTVFVEQLKVLRLSFFIWACLFRTNYS